MSPGSIAINVCLVNLGCHKNQVDAEIISGALDDAGFHLVGDAEDADIVLVNTCGFLSAAREESAEILEEMAVLRASGRLERLVVTGCMADRDRAWLLDRVPMIDQFISSFQLDILPQTLLETPTSNSPVSASDFLWAESPRWLITPPSYAFLKIADGCDNRCSYCRIPYLRGPLRTKLFDDVLEEAEAIIASGRREIVLISQDNTAFGMDQKTSGGITRLVEELSTLSELRRLRLMYMYPSRLDRKLLELMARTENVCNYLDIPFQHVNATVLKAMNRSLPRFLNEPEMDVVAFLKEIRMIVPGITIRTTLMTGFPGEDQRAYDELEQLIDSNVIDHLGVFAWSPEPDTPAWNLKSQWNQKLAEDRAARLQEIQAGFVEERNLLKLGKEYDVVIDENETDEDGLVWSNGRMESQAPEVDGIVRVAGEIEPGEYVKAKLDSVEIYDFTARIAGELPVK